MTYENAPATKMLATHCAVCSRPLVDAKSVELGIGPECRKKYGFDLAVSEEARTRANRLVYLIALNTLSFNDLKDAVEGLHNLGFTALARIITSRKCAVQVTSTPTGVLADLPYNPDALPALRRVGHAVRENDKFKGWAVSDSNRNALFAVMKRYYSGLLGVGPRGMFEIPRA